MRHEGFYSATAQVIPLVIVVLVFQLRRRKTDPFDAIVFMVASAALITGEAVSLRALYVGHTSTVGRGIVFLGLYFGANAVIFEIVRERLGPMVEHSPYRAQLRVWFVAWMVATTAGMSYGALTG